MTWKEIEKGYWKLGETDSVLAYFKKAFQSDHKDLIKKIEKAFNDEELLYGDWIKIKKFLD